MNDFIAYLWIALGVVIAVVLPVMIAHLKKEFPQEETFKAPDTKSLPPWLKKYLYLGAFSLIVALVSLAIWKNSNPNTQLVWYSAFVIGFAWESAVEKFFRPVAKPSGEPKHFKAVA
jgi:hypothetical protein